MFLLVVSLAPEIGKLGLISLRKQLMKVFAQEPQAFEAESGQVTAPATVGTDPNAAGGSYVQFGAPSVNFQPSSPYYATFYYQWYKNSSTDGSWSYWSDHGNKPPSTWFSHFIPDNNPASFDPANELYSSNDYNNFKWQVAKMAEAKQEVAIASWFGPATREDVAFGNIVNSFMTKPDNPYPNLRWSIYYEDEGFADPAVSTIVSDLNHLKDKYTQSPYFFKIGGKPVIFVYADAADGSAMAKRWKDANSQIGNSFYVVLKVFAGYATDPNQPDSWHQYAPAVRSGSHVPYSAYVSPGFWLDDGSLERLVRNSADFENAVKAMVSANVAWKLTETWNEWGEGTSVEPGEQVRFNSATAKDEPDPGGYQFKNLYIDILNRNLPALEAGTGAVPSPQPPPCSQVATTLGAVEKTIGLDSQGTYKIWSRIYASDSTVNSYYLQIDTDCPIVVGDNGAMPSREWVWIDYKDGADSNKISVSLSAGVHNVKLIGREGGVRLDRLIFSSDLSCIPSGTGDNCVLGSASSPTPAPSPPPEPTPTSSPSPPADNDSDSDGFKDVLEQYLGTDPNRACPVTRTASDEAVDPWPPDFDDNRVVNTFDILAFSPHMGATTGSQGFSSRFDLDANGVINVFDIQALSPYMGRACK